jgi:hypothetical protein
MRSVQLFIREWFREWWALMGCAAFTFLGIYIAKTGQSNDWIVKASFVFGTVFFFVASYRAWKRQYEKTLELAAKIDDLTAIKPPTGFLMDVQVRDFYDCEWASRDNQHKIPHRTAIGVQPYVKNGMRDLVSMESIVRYGTELAALCSNNFSMCLRPDEIYDRQLLWYDLHGVDANYVDSNAVEWGFRDRYGDWHFLKLNVPDTGFIPAISCRKKSASGFRIGGAFTTRLNIFGNFRNPGGGLGRSLPASLSSGFDCDEDGCSRARANARWGDPAGGRLSLVLQAQGETIGVNNGAVVKAVSLE